MTAKHLLDEIERGLDGVTAGDAFSAQNYNCPCAHPSQCDNSCFPRVGFERLSIRVGGSGDAAYAFTETDDEGDYVTYSDAKRAIMAAEARATAAEATVTALQEALEAIADEPTLGEPFKSENRIMPRDMMIERTRTALTTIRRTAP